MVHMSAHMADHTVAHTVEVQVRSPASGNGNYSIGHFDSTFDSDDTSGSMPADGQGEWGN